jgi:chemotaxis protein CheC
MSQAPITAPSLGPRELDALQEVASIGCGQALTALGRLMRRRIDMDVPEAWVGRTAGAVADFLGAMGRELVLVGVRLEGLVAGHLVLALPERDAARLAACLGQPLSETGRWGELAESALMESGNIVGSAFVSAIARMIGGRLLLSVPALARGGGRSCLDRLVERDSAWVALATRFSTQGPDGLEGLILVLPHPARIRALLASLHAA